jgi:hypothetical protein
MELGKGDEGILEGGGCGRKNMGGWWWMGLRGA